MHTFISKDIREASNRKKKSYQLQGHMWNYQRRRRNSWQDENAWSYQWVCIATTINLICHVFSQFLSFLSQQKFSGLIVLARSLRWNSFNQSIGTHSTWRVCNWASPTCVSPSSISRASVYKQLRLLLANIRNSSQIDNACECNDEFDL